MKPEVREIVSMNSPRDHHIEIAQTGILPGLSSYQSNKQQNLTEAAIKQKLEQTDIQSKRKFLIDRITDLSNPVLHLLQQSAEHIEVAIQDPIRQYDFKYQRQQIGTSVVEEVIPSKGWSALFLPDEKIKKTYENTRTHVSWKKELENLILNFRLIYATEAGKVRPENLSLKINPQIDNRYVRPLEINLNVKRSSISDLSFNGRFSFDRKDVNENSFDFTKDLLDYWQSYNPYLDVNDFKHLRENTGTRYFDFIEHIETQYLGYETRENRWKEYNSNIIGVDSNLNFGPENIVLASSLNAGRFIFNQNPTVKSDFVTTLYYLPTDYSRLKITNQPTENIAVLANKMPFSIHVYTSLLEHILGFVNFK